MCLPSVTLHITGLCNCNSLSLHRRVTWTWTQEFISTVSCVQHTAAITHRFSVYGSEVADCRSCVTDWFQLVWDISKRDLTKEWLEERCVYVCCFSECVKLFVCVSGRDAYRCCDSGGAFPFWEPPSSHLFFSSLASMPSDSHWVKGFSCSIPPEDHCQSYVIIVSTALLQSDGFQHKLERKFQWKFWIYFLSNPLTSCLLC